MRSIEELQDMMDTPTESWGVEKMHVKHVSAGKHYMVRALILDTYPNACRFHGDIYVNDHMLGTEEDFLYLALAHELAHRCLHGNSGSTPQKEMEADKLSKTILHNSGLPYNWDEAMLKTRELFPSHLYTVDPVTHPDWDDRIAAFVAVRVR